MKINGETHYLWRAIDHEGEALESYAIKTQDKPAALRFLKKALKRHGRAEQIVTDGLGSYPAATCRIKQAEHKTVPDRLLTQALANRAPSTQDGFASV